VEEAQVYKQFVNGCETVAANNTTFVLIYVENSSKFTPGCGTSPILNF